MPHAAHTAPSPPASARAPRVRPSTAPPAAREGRGAWRARTPLPLPTVAPTHVPTVHSLKGADPDLVQREALRGELDHHEAFPAPLGRQLHRLLPHLHAARRRRVLAARRREGWGGEGGGGRERERQIRLMTKGRERAGKRERRGGRAHLDAEDGADVLLALEARGVCERPAPGLPGREFLRDGPHALRLLPAPAAAAPAAAGAPLAPASSLGQPRGICGALAPRTVCVRVRHAVRLVTLALTRVARPLLAPRRRLLPPRLLQLPAEVVEPVRPLPPRPARPPASEPPSSAVAAPRAAHRMHLVLCEQPTPPPPRASN